jgi:hypothetical protein
MQVNVFVTRFESNSQYRMLIIPYGENYSIPSELQDESWRHLAVTSLDDRLLKGSEPIIRAQMDVRGYGLLTVTR